MKAFYPKNVDLNSSLRSERSVNFSKFALRLCNYLCLYPFSAANAAFGGRYLPCPNADFSQYINQAEINLHLLDGTILQDDFTQLGLNASQFHH